MLHRSGQRARQSITGPAVILICLAAAGVRAQGVVPIGTTDVGPPQSRIVRLPDPRQTIAPPRRNPGIRLASAEQPMPQPPTFPEPIPRGQPDNGVGISLEEITAITLGNNPLIAEAEANAEAARGKAWQAGRYPNPTFGSAAPQLAGNQSQYNAYVIQDLVTKGKIGLDRAAAERYARETELVAVRARFDALTTMRQRFYSTLVAQLRVDVLSRMVTITRNARDVGKKVLDAGLGRRGEFLLLDLDLAQAERELTNAYTVFETSKRQLAASTGVIDLPIERVAGDLQQAHPHYELPEVQQNVLARNALVGSAEFEVARNQFVLRRAQVEPFPNVNFLGGYQNQQPGAQAPESQALYQVQMVVPLWNKNQGNIRAAQANIGSALAQLQRVRTELANASAAALARYLTAQQSVERFEKQILPIAVEAQKIQYQLYDQGQVDFLLYLQSQRTLLTANLEYIAAQEIRWNAAAELAGLLQSDQFP